MRIKEQNTCLVLQGKKHHKFGEIKSSQSYMTMTQVSWLQHPSRDAFFLACLRVYKHVIVNVILNLGIIEGVQE